MFCVLFQNMYMSLEILINLELVLLMLLQIVNYCFLS